MTEYQRFLNDNPQIQKTLSSIEERFANEKKSPCDHCKINPIGATSFSVFVTPEKPHACLLVCIECLKALAAKHHVDLPTTTKLN